MKKKYVITLAALLCLLFAACAVKEPATQQLAEIDVPKEVEPEPYAPDSFPGYLNAEMTAEEAEALLAKSDKPDNYANAWHAAPGMPSGYAERYFFREDGTFIYLHNTMDGASREIGLKGKWQAKNEQMLLTITEKEMREGGIPVPGYASYASDYVLEGAVYRTIDLDEQNYETRIYSISPVYLWASESSDGPAHTVFINGQQYWDSIDNNEDTQLYLSADYATTSKKSFDYAAAGGGRVYEYKDLAGEGVQISGLPSVIIDNVKYYVQEARADLNGDGLPEDICVYYGVWEYSPGNEDYINTVNMQVSNNLGLDHISFYVNNPSFGISFVDVDKDDKYTQVCIGIYNTYLFTFTDSCKIVNGSVYGYDVSFDGKGKIYTEYSYLTDDNQTLVAYFDLERGLLPLPKENIIGLRISFPYDILLFEGTRQRSVLFPKGIDFIRNQMTINYTPKGYDDIVAEIPAGQKLEVLDFYFRLDDGSYEIIPWLKLRTEDGVEGWVRTGEF